MRKDFRRKEGNSDKNIPPHLGKLMSQRKRVILRRPQEPEKKGFWENEKKLDDVQEALDHIGMIPVVGSVASLANTQISLKRGKYLDVLLSALSIIPVVGTVIKGGKFLLKKAGKPLGNMVTGSKKLFQKATEQLEKLKNEMKTHLSNERGSWGKDKSKGIDNAISDGRVTVNSIKSNPSVFSGKNADEIAGILKSQGYDVTVKASTKSRSGAQIIKINNPGNGRNITQLQVSPGGGRHGDNPYIKISTSDQGIIKIVDGTKNTYKTDGKENATIIFTGK